MPLLAALLVAVALVVGVAPASGAERWRRPLDGEVVGAYSFDREAPFERGRRRGIDLRGRPGDAVRAACPGLVTFAGTVPGRGAGRGVSVRCGPLVATHLGLAAVRIRAGARVRAGAVVGILGRAGILRLGARRAADRLGYVDPAPLLEGGAAGPAPRVVPLGRAPRGGRRVRPRPSRRPSARGPGRPAAPARPGTETPPVVWLGLALAAGGLAGSLTPVVRRRRKGAVTRPGAAVVRR